MGITAKQAEARRQSIGSSDIAAIMGYDGRRSAYDVWCEKTGRATGFTGNEHTRRGDILEPAIGQLVAETMGKRVVAPKAAFVHGRCRAHVDFQTPEFGRGHEIIEAKSAVMAEGWGEPGTDAVPDRVLLQVHHQMLCADSPKAHVARLDGYLNLTMYCVHRDRDVDAHIETTAARFWRDYVESDTPPPMHPVTDATLDYLSGRERAAGACTPVDPAIVAAFADARDARLAAEKAEREAKAYLLAALGDASVGESCGFQVSVSRVNRKPQLTHKAIAEYSPRLAARLLDRLQVEGSSYPRLTVKRIEEGSDDE